MASASASCQGTEGRRGFVIKEACRGSQKLPDLGDLLTVTVVKEQVHQRTLVQCPEHLATRPNALLKDIKHNRDSLH